MRRRTNPWPAFVDLFSALLVVAFAGFILMTSSGYKGAGTVAELQARLGAFERQQREVTKVRSEADQILKDLEGQLEEGQLQTRTMKCGEDACLDLFIQYPLNKASIPEGDPQALQLEETCRTLRSALDSFPPNRRHDIEVLVEGHTDRTQARTASPSEAYLTNWRLSSQRAASVLWIFRECGLKPPEYSVSMVGYADSEKVCFEPTPECDQKNRRTTLRLRANTQKISERLAAGQN